MNKNEWFLDTFAAIMSVSQDSDDVETLAESSIGRPIDTDQSSMKLMSSECSANPELLEYCQKFCAVNNCSYSKGLYKLMIPIADILAVDAARTISIFSALYQYRKKFTIPILTDEEKNFGSKWSQWYWSAGAWSSSSSIGSKSNLSPIVEFLCAFIRYHRPGVAYLLETFFGPDMGYKQYWSNWLSDSFISVSESLGFARELMSTIASTGEPLTSVLMTVAILEEIIVRTTAKDDLADAISNFRLGYENLNSIWLTASEMASHTPRMFSQDFSGLLRRDEKRINHSVVSEFSVLGLSVEYILRDLLDTQEQEKELETSPVGSSPGVLHSVIADEDFGGGMKNLPPLRCIAGASISQHLWVYSNNSVIGSPIVSSRGDRDDSPTVYIDARSEEERNSDNKTVIVVPIAVYNRPVPLSPRNLTTSKPSKPDHQLGTPSRERDWFADDEDGEEEADAPPPLPTGPSEKFILYRFRPFVWMDVDEDELDTDDTTSASYAFMKKLEFFRNYRLCVIGGKKGIVAKKLVASLLRREFPYITSVRRKRRQVMSKSGFGMIRDEIANFTTVDVLEKIAIVSEIGELRPPPSPPSPPSPTTPPETRGIYSVSSSGSRFLANVKKQMSTNRFGKLMRQPPSSFRKRSSAQPVVPTLVLAPTPVEDPRPLPELDFEIGSSSNEEEEIDFPSNSNDIRHV